MDVSTLENYITRYGWSYERYDEVVMTVVQAGAGDFPVAFQLAPPWLRLSVPALASGVDRSNEYYANLLRLNERARLARFALDEAGGVMLCVDLYTIPPPTFEQFSLALDVLVYYADAALPHLQAVGEEDDGDERE